MKKKFLNLLFTPIFITPVVAFSCSDNTVALNSFTYDSEKYQLYIIPTLDSENTYDTIANILIRLKYDENNDNNQSDMNGPKIDVGDVTILDSYKNPNNGKTYKTNRVSFDLDKDSYNSIVKYTTPTLSKFMYYNINNFTVNGNAYITESAEYDHKHPYNIKINNQVDMNVSVFDNNGTTGVFDNTSQITFSDRLVALDNFGMNNKKINITLPNSLKTIGTKKGGSGFYSSSIYQQEFTIPQSVEQIYPFAFYSLYGSNNSDSEKSSDESATTTKNKIKVPEKFQSQESNIFNANTKRYFDIEYYS